jgi:hypothetical protein
MCRSIKVLRPPYTNPVTPDDVHAAALQYVRKVSGFHRPAAHNQEVFDAAVAAVAGVTADLLDRLSVRGAAGGARTAPSGAAGAGSASGSTRGSGSGMRPRAATR